MTTEELVNRFDDLVNALERIAQGLETLIEMWGKDDE